MTKLKNTLTFLSLSLLVTSYSLDVSSEIYKWTDENGRVHYGDRPKGKQAAEVDIKTNKPGQDTPGDDWQTIKQRQQKYLEYLEDERQDRDDEKAKVAEQRAERKERCDEVTKYHQKLLSNPTWYRKDEDGNKVYLDYKEKDAEILKTEKLMKKYCAK